MDQYVNIEFIKIPYPQRLLFMAKFFLRRASICRNIFGIWVSNDSGDTISNGSWQLD